MWTIYQPLSLWAQLASLCFMCSGTNCDVLVIRFFLLMAYLMNFLNAILGSPHWPHVSNVGGINIDSVVWCIIGLYVHGSSLVCLILDERRRRPFTDEEAALWRLLYRTGGLSEKLFETIILPHLEVVEYGIGDDIPTPCSFYIIYQGRVRLRVVSSDDDCGEVVVHDERIKIAGEMFAYKHLNLLEPQTAFYKHEIVCTALTTQTKLFRIHKDAMARIVHHRFAKSLWQALLINNLSNLVEQSMRNLDGAGLGTREDKLFGPLQDWELPKPDLAGSGSAMKHPLLHLINSIRRSFTPPWPWGGHPTGIRQTQLRPPPPEPPTHTTMAQSERSRPDSPSYLFPARCKHNNTIAKSGQNLPPHSDDSAVTDVGTISNDARGGGALHRESSSHLDCDYGGETCVVITTDATATLVGP